MEFDIQVKLTVFRHFAKTGQRPSIADVADRVGAGTDRVLDTYQRLRAERVLVLDGRWIVHSNGTPILWRSYTVRRQGWCEAVLR